MLVTDTPKGTPSLLLGWPEAGALAWMTGVGLDQPGALPLSVEGRARGRGMTDRPAFLSVEARARGRTGQGQGLMGGVSNRGGLHQPAPGLTTLLLGPPPMVCLALAPPTGHPAGAGSGPQSGPKEAVGVVMGRGIATGVATGSGPATQRSGSTPHLPDHLGPPVGLMDTAL